MTEQEAIELLGSFYEMDEMYDAAQTAINALEKIQQYMAIGTVNEFKALKEKWLNKFDSLIEYRKIGTPEECREAVEKIRKIEEVIKEWDKVGYAYSNNHMCEIKMILKGGGTYEQ